MQSGITYQTQPVVFLSRRIYHASTDSDQANEASSLYFDEQSGTQYLWFFFLNDSGEKQYWRWAISTFSAFKEWKHIIITWDGNFESKPILYLNNISQGGGSATTSYVGTTRKVINYIQLTGKNGASDELQGSLMEIAWFNKELNSDERQIVYNNGNFVSLPGSTIKNEIFLHFKLGEEEESLVTFNPGYGTLPSSFKNLSLGDTLPQETHISASIGGGFIKVYGLGVITISEGFYQKLSDQSLVSKSNNFNYQSIIPSSDYNYSWATSSLGDNYSVRSGAQKVFGYWPKDGLNKVNGVLDSAITFPTSSDIYATYGE